MTEKTKRPPIPQGVRFNVLRRDNFACRYCGRSSPEVVLHLDHVKPYSRGGGDGEDNLITACFDCNMGKSAKTGVVPPVNLTPVVRGSEEDKGLVGMFGHTFDEGGDMQNQFHIERKADGKYVCQLFEWMMGEPSIKKVWGVEYLSGPLVTLYGSKEDWHWAHEQFARKQAVKYRAQF